MDKEKRFSPFRVTVVGRSVSELKQNMVAFLAELNGEEITAQDPGQLEFANIKTAPRPGMSVAAGSINFETDKGPMHIPAVPPILPPIPAPAAAPQGAVNAEVDSKGLPWDSRIHAVSSGKNKDGSWRYRRGVEDALVTQVEHELIAKIKTSGSEAAPLPQIPNAPLAFAPPAPVSQSAPVPQPVFQPVAASPVPQTTLPGPVIPPTLQTLQQSPPLAFTPPALVIQPPPVNTPVASAHTLQTFREQLVPVLGQLTESGKINQEYVAAVKRHFGVDQIWNVNDAQLAEMFNTFCEAGFLTRVV